MIHGDDIYNWEALGARLANLSDEEQGKFFGGFLREMISWRNVSNFARYMQMTYVGSKLSADEKDLLSHACS